MLEEKLHNLPDKPGVYLMKDETGQIIYVGKAISLKNRVKSYFSSQHIANPKTRILVSHIRDLEVILTDTEVEALILECNLIKKHRPKYNIRLTDDKSYPYLRLTLQEDFPRLELVRTLKRDGSRYFGPYTNTGFVHQTLKLLKKVFPLRSCHQAVLTPQKRPCLNAHIGRCGAPCTGAISQEDYRKIIQEVLLFLEGKQEDLIKLLSERMEVAAQNLEFEKAAELRDQLLSIERVVAKQKMVLERLLDLDVINYARGQKEVCVQVFFIRQGKLVGREHFFMEGAEGSDSREILSSFLTQYYSSAEFIPGEILLAELPEDQGTLETWLTEKRGGRVALKIPKLGEKKKLLELVGKNALESLQQEIEARARRSAFGLAALDELTLVLGLQETPRRIECYDISHIQGVETVASMVVFTDGKADTSQYRRFKIRTVAGVDDFASMAEVISRRFAKADEGNEKFGRLPQLLVIDGGRGQLSATREVMKQRGYADIPAVGLAKENEWVFQESSPDPLILSRDSLGLQLLQRIRDEAHRFALGYHRLLRGKRQLTSALDDIKGIGAKRKASLIKHFGLSLKKISQASVQELSEVGGFNRQLAQEVWEYFHPPE